MNTVYERRRANLARLLREPGAKRDLAIRLDFTAANISNWLRDPGKTGAREIHEDKAREIERALGLSSGELDRPAASGPALVSVHRKEPERATVPHSVMGGLDVPAPPLAEVASLVLSEVSRRKRNFAPAKVAAILALAYGHAAERGAIDSAYVAALIQLME